MANKLEIISASEDAARKHGTGDDAVGELLSGGAEFWLGLLQQGPVHLTLSSCLWPLAAGMQSKALEVTAAPRLTEDTFLEAARLQSEPS